MTENNVKKLERSTTDRWLGGVCGGVANYTGWDANLIRVALIVLTVVGFGSAIIAYLAAWILMPLQPPASTSTAVDG